MKKITVQIRKTNDFIRLCNKAHEAGMKAGYEVRPTPMIVSEADIQGNRIGKSWYVDDGACGFAWIAFKGNTAFGKWAKAQGIARPHYPSGLCVWVGEFGQSVDRKSAYAGAYAQVLRDAGIDAYADSRLD
jgi:hypothetical protein